MRLEQFGAFMELEPGIEGLLHVSELAGTGGHVNHAKDKAKVGDKLEIVVLSSDVERHRLSLGLASKHDETHVDVEGAALARGPVTMGTFGDLFKKSTGSQSQDKAGRKR
jgi:ribosomal protein S1